MSNEKALAKIPDYPDYLEYPTLFKHISIGNEYYFCMNIVPLKINKNIVFSYKIVINVYIYKNQNEEWAKLHLSEEVSTLEELSSVIEKMLNEAKIFEKQNL